jgi:hypothetical protein
MRENFLEQIIPELGIKEQENKKQCLPGICIPPNPIWLSNSSTEVVFL